MKEMKMQIGMIGPGVRGPDAYIGGGIGGRREG